MLLVPLLFRTASRTPVVKVRCGNMQLYAHGRVAGRVVCGVGSYVIPWESRVNSCHLRFSCSEFYADSKK